MKGLRVVFCRSQQSTHFQRLTRMQQLEKAPGRGVAVIIIACEKLKTTKNNETNLYKINKNTIE